MQYASNWLVAEQSGDFFESPIHLGFITRRFNQYSTDSHTEYTIANRIIQAQKLNKKKIERKKRRRRRHCETLLFYRVVPLDIIARSVLPAMLHVHPQPMKK